MAPRTRSPVFYRIALVLPIAMLAYLAASGRIADYWHAFSVGASAPSAEQFKAAFTSGVLWIASLAPLLFAAWELGRAHTAARRLGYDLFVGFRAVVRHASGRELSAVDQARAAAEYARPPQDNPRAAIALGAGVALFLPAFFATFVSPLRSPGGLLWLGVAGALVGSGAYARRRAMAYLREEPARLDLFREWRLLNPSRYEEPGHRFVRWQQVILVLLPVWWLGVGPWLAFGW